MVNYIVNEQGVHNESCFL